MNDVHILLARCCMEDSTLRALLEQWFEGRDQKRKERIEQTILGIIEERERTNFIVRFILRNYDSWHKVLTEEESDLSKAHNGQYYEPHLLAVLADNKEPLEPIKAIREVVERVKDELTLADFFLTDSKRFRYDTTIRILAHKLKERGVLSKDKEHKNKFWALAPKQQSQLF